MVIERLTNRRVVLLALVLNVMAVAAFALWGPSPPAGSPGVVALQLAFTKGTFANIIQQWGPSGVRAYQTSTVWIDSWFPLAYALLLSSLMAVLAARAGGRAARLGHAPFAWPWLAMVLDWLENTLHLILLRNPSDLSATWVLVASLAAAIKWGLIAVTILVLVFCLLGPLVYNWVKQR
jgi:hypothetical protein